MCNSDIFVSVRQRVNAFKIYKEFCLNRYGIKITIENEDEYLDEVFRFLNKSIDKGFIEMCADYENMSFEDYCNSMGIDTTTDF